MIILKRTRGEELDMKNKIKEYIRCNEIVNFVLSNKYYADMFLNGAFYILVGGMIYYKINIIYYFLLVFVKLFLGEIFKSKINMNMPPVPRMRYTERIAGKIGYTLNMRYINEITIYLGNVEDFLEAKGLLKVKR